MPDQSDQILSMNKSLGNISTDSLIQQCIKSGKYSSKDSINRCNLFVQDMLKEHFNISLPTRKEVENEDFLSVTSSGKVDPKSWPDNPISPGTVGMYLDTMSKLNSGISEVDPVEGSKLALNNVPVIAVGGGHLTLSAPDLENAKVYRSDLHNRGEDKRTIVGIKPDTKLKFYSIDPKLYNNMRNISKGIKVDKLFGDYTDEYKNLANILNMEDNNGG